MEVLRITENEELSCFPISVNGICLKPLQKYISMISKKLMIITVKVLPPDGSRLRYSEIKERIEQTLSKKVSDTTISTRLKELLEYGIVEKIYHKEIPPRVEYNLTTRGKEFVKTLEPIVQWAIKDCHEG